MPPRVRFMSTPRRRKAPPARAGAAVVEFAFVAPLLFLCVLVLFEIGRVFMVMHALETAAREGCRTAVPFGATQEEVTGAVAARLKTFGVSGHTITTTPATVTTAKQFEPVTVSVSVSYKQITVLPIVGTFLNTKLVGSTTIPKESELSD